MVIGGRTRVGRVFIFSRGGNCIEKREDGTVYEVHFVQTDKMTAGGTMELPK